MSVRENNNSSKKKNYSLTIATAVFNGFWGAVSGLIVGGLFFDEPALGTVIGALLSIAFFVLVSAMMKSDSGIGAMIPIIGDQEIDVESFKRLSGIIEVKSLRARNIEIIGNLKVKNSLILLKNGSLEIHGLVDVFNDFICDGKALITGPCKIKGEIQGDNIIIKASLEADSINVKNLSVVGNLTVRNNIVATESIVLRLSSSTKINVGGYLEAPEIILKAKTQKQIKNSLFKLLRLSRELPIIVRGIKIRGSILRLDGIRVEESDIEVENIEYLR